MASKESRQCPHFDTHDGVCGCPEFWQPAKRPQDDRSSSLPEVSNACYGQGAPNGQFSSSVNSIPLPDRTKTQPSTPAPPGPPKETCFFWYHSACRRGDECDRPHEAHPTWPIPPPPGFRHFKPCTLPLCPLRTDLETTTKSQEYQQRRRTMGGQLDGAAFSRATTAGESTSDNDSDNNTDTDMSEAGEDKSVISSEEILGAGVASQVPAGKASEGGTDQAGEVKVQQRQGKSEFDESDYVGLSQSLSPPSTPLVQEETLLSISHSGTLRKRRQLPTVHTSESNNKREKLDEGNSPNFDNVIPILQRPRNMPQWDSKPPGLGLDGQYPEPGASYFAAMHGKPQRPECSFAAKESPIPFVPQPFNPPQGPRSMSALPPICFFYYHKGYCNPKRGRRCDYLHDTSTSQQTVSLPYGIDNHDSTCSLPLCPVRLRSLDQAKQKLEPFAPSAAFDVGHEPVTPPRPKGPPFFKVPDSFLSVRSRPPKGMLGQPLPRLTGLTRDRFEEQRCLIEQVQANDDTCPAASASVVESVYQQQVEKQAKRKKRGDKKRMRVNAADELQSQMQEQGSIQHELSGQPIGFSMQPPLPSLSISEETPTPAAIQHPTGKPNKKRRKDRSRKPLHNQRTEEFWLGDSIKHEGIQGFTPETVQGLSPSWPLPGSPLLPQLAGYPVLDGDKRVSIDRVLEMVETMNRNPRNRRPLIVSPQWRPSEKTLPHEYSQESLGLTTEERRAEIYKIQAARREVCNRSLLVDYEHWSAASEGMGYLAARAAAPKVQREAGNEGLLRQSRCQGCRNSRADCDRQGSCQGCEGAGIETDSCVNRVESNNKKERDVAALSTDNTAEYQLPKGDQRLDWDTDLVRHLFGEIEQ